ncbi:MAG: YceI family protein [Polaribacter sp.]
MKKLIVFCFLVVSISVFSQTYFTRSGNTDFKASVEAFEPVEAKNTSTTVILKTATGDIAAQLFINAFQFKVALMQEHFNENYMDSNKYPKAVFRGKLIDFDFTNATTEKEYKLTGILTVRGVKKEITTTANVILKENTLYIDSKFTVAPQDFKIDIPNIVRKKIADKINLTLHYELVEKK